MKLIFYILIALGFVVTCVIANRRRHASSRNPEVGSEESAYPQPRIRHPKPRRYRLLYSHALRRRIDVSGEDL